MKIKKKLPLMIVLLVSVSLIITNILTYYISSKIVNNDNREILLSKVVQEKETVYSLIEGERKEANLMSMQKTIIDVSKARNQKPGDDFFTDGNAIFKEANSILKERFDKLQFHEHLFVADKNGIIFADSNEKTLKIDIKERDYFKKALSGQANISNTIISKVDGKPIVTFSAPVKDEKGEILGVMVNSAYVDYFSKYLSGVKINKTGYMYMVDSEGIVLSHPDKGNIAKPTGSEVIKTQISKLKKGEKIEPNVEKYVYKGINKIQSYDVIPDVNWFVSSTCDMSDMNASINGMLRNSIIITVLTIILAGIIGIMVSRSITTPINKLANIMEKASEGDLTVKSEINSKDELGILSKSFNTMTESIKSLVENINSSMNTVSSTVNNLVDTSKNTSISIEEVAKTVEQIAEGSSHQSQNVEEVVSKAGLLGEEIEKLNNHSKEMKENSDKIVAIDESSREIFKKLIEKTEQNDKALEEVYGIIDKLQERSENIGAIIEAISNIAEQTNLLALNAAIEAARAGESGRGFAVVAEEVRKLAEESSNSTKEIEKIVTDIKSRTSEAVDIVSKVKGFVKEQGDAVGETGDMFKTISSNISNIAIKIENVNKALVNMNSSKEEVINDMQGVSAVTEQTAASAEEVSASTEEQSAAMQELAASVSNLDKMVEDLSQSIKIFKI